MIEFNDPREGIMFDLYGDGRPIRVSWPVNIDAFWLALDRNGNGRIDGGQELFGDAVHLKNGSRAKHGYEALAEFDENQDGRIDRSDSIFRTLIWWRRPINDHGTWMPDVMIPVDKLGVESISLESFESARQDKWGNRFRFRAPVNLTNGQNIWSFDVFIVKAEDALRPATRRIEAEPRR